MTPAAHLQAFLILPALPDPRLSPNQVRRLNHQQLGRIVNEQRDIWLWRLREALGAPPHPKLRTPVSITITVSGVGRKMDVQSWVMHYGFKVLVDCITEPSLTKRYGLGLIPDDRPGYVSAVTVRVEQRGEKCTKLELVHEEALR